MTTHSPKCLLVTGHSGFVGSVVIDSIARRHDWLLKVLPATFDLRERESVIQAINEVRPDAVLHLAGQSSVLESFRDPEGTLAINFNGTLHLLQALTSASFTGRMLYVSSGDVYGHVPEAQLPIMETRLTLPRNPYAVSKLAAEALCWQWFVSHGLDVVIVRPFNHIGPRQSERFVIADFARQLAAIECGKQAPILRVGDIDSTRDFTDVRDVVAAYFALLDCGTSGERYNVCSGVERSIRSMLNELIALAGVTVQLVQDPERLRSSEQRRMCGNNAKLRNVTGWAPQIPIAESLKGTFSYWKTQIENG